MAKVSNPGRVPFTLPTRHVVPAGGSVEVTNDTLRECMRAIGGLVAIGDLSVAWDDEGPAPEPGRAPPAGAGGSRRTPKKTAPDPAL
jgi:hypothetical protein